MIYYNEIVGKATNVPILSVFRLHSVIIQFIRAFPFQCYSQLVLKK
jgi:hypothetical protein